MHSISLPSVIEISVVLAIAAELFVLFYNGILPAFHKMKDKIEHYNMIENLLIEDLIKPEHYKFYPKCKMKSVKDLLK